MATALCFRALKVFCSPTGRFPFEQINSSFTKTACFVQVNYNKSLTYSRNTREFVFQVYPRMNYDAFKEYNLFKKYFDKASLASEANTAGAGKTKGVSSADKIRMIQLKKKLQEEISTNKKIFERRRGELVQYGNEIQLLHYDSHSFLEGSKNCADLDKSCNMVRLNCQGTKQVCFVVEPRYKYRNPGSSVNYQDVVVFRNLKNNQYLHISTREVILPKIRSKQEIQVQDSAKFKQIIPDMIDRRMLPDEFAALYEVNTSSLRSNFTIRPYRSFDDDINEQIVKGGQVVRFQHSESAGYICSDDNDFTGDGLAEVFFWNFKGKSTDIEATSMQSYFELEIVSEMDEGLGKTCQYSGNSSNETANSGGMLFRLRHLNTGRLVIMQEIQYDQELLLSLGLSEHLPMNINVQNVRGKAKCYLDCNDLEFQKNLELNSIYRLVSTGVDMESGIEAGTSVQIQHVASGTWLTQNPKYKLDLEVEKKEVQPELDEEEMDDSQIQQDVVLYKTEFDQNLDKTLFQKIDDKFVNQASRDMMLLEKQASFENAFFILPERQQGLQKILFVHTSVNYLNNFLAEIADRNYGQSRERQKKIESVLLEMIEWIQTDDDDMETEVTQYQLDVPFSIKSNDSLSAKMDRLAIKQKIMRELRVIECLVDILHVPFACGAFEYVKLTQDMAITNLCKLSYTLLSLIVRNYRLNELYASQWIGLYLSHILNTEKENQIGADQFMTQLIDENFTILEHQITTKIIYDFIQDCQRNTESARLFKLITALCALQDSPCIQNQIDVITCILDNPEEKQKFLMPIRRLRRSKPIEICFDIAKDQWTPLTEVSEQFEQINQNFTQMLAQDPNSQLPAKDREFMNIYNLMLELFNLYAESCLFRNTENQQKLAPFFPSKVLIAIFEDKAFNYSIRSRCLKFYLTLHLDKAPFQYLQIPSGFTVFKDLPAIDTIGDQLIEEIKQNKFIFPIKFSKVKIPPSMLEIKSFLDQIFKSPQGILDQDDPERCEFLLECLKTLRFMLNHGFYSSQEELSEVAVPIVNLLNGANSKKKKSTQELQEMDDEEQKMQSRERYFPESPDEVTIQSKCLACDILLRISSLEQDAKCTIFFAKLKQDILKQQQNEEDQQIQLSDQPKSNKDQNQNQSDKLNFEDEAKQDLILFETIAATKGFESVNEEQYICVLLDLMLYRETGLTQRVFSLLINYFTRKRLFIENLYQTQILESSKSIKTMSTIKTLYSQLKKQQSEMQFWLTKHNTTGQEGKISVTNIFNQLTAFCIAKEAQAIVLDDSDGQQDRSLSRSKTMNSQSRLEVQQQQEKIEEFLIFEVDKNNAFPNKENQRVLQSFDVAEVALQIIKQRVDRITNSNELYIDLVKSCYRFLIAYVRNNFQNQLRIYDDIDVFMRDIEKYYVASLLFYEIFKDNKKFLTLNVTKFLRTINNTAEEVSLSSTKKALYLKLLEVFCRYGDKLVRSNQSEIILQMTADTTRSNVLYLFQAEGAKELGGHILQSLKIEKEENTNLRKSRTKTLQSQEEIEQNSIEMNQTNQTQKKRKNDEINDNEYSQTGGLIKMSIPIFNVIQLLQLVTLCCSGKSDFAEKKCKESILNFKVASNILYMSQDFWPLKIAIFDYISNCYMDSNDPEFMKKPDIGQQDEAEELTEEQQAASDVNVLLKCIEILNQDIDDYVNGRVRQTKLQMPNGKKLKMSKLNEEYLFVYGLDFIRNTLKRKTYDVGSVELKFYVIVKNCAQLFYSTNEKKNKIKAYELLNYIYSSERHAKYLDNVKHPAKAKKNSKEILELYENADLNQKESNQTVGIVEVNESNKLSNKILQMANSEEMKVLKEQEFNELVNWLTSMESRVKKIMSVTKGKVSSQDQLKAFENVNYTNFICSLLRLLDARVLSKQLQITGLSLLRKIVEVENKGISTPSADWDTEDWVAQRRIIQMKQDSLIQQGTIQFLCKQISSNEDVDIQEECLLVLISLSLGGNAFAQKTFYDFMINEDPNNNFLIAIKQLLLKNFELTKKYMIEKNAKLDMIYKLKKKQALKSEQRQAQLDAEQAKMQIKKPRSILRCFRRAMVDQDPQNQESNENDVDKVNQEEEENGDESEENLMAADVREEEREADEEEQTGIKVKKPVSIEQLEENAKKKYLTTTIRILRFLQLLCEGHYADLQNNLREQKTPGGSKNPRSFDFVAYVSQLMSIYVKSYVNCYSTTLGNQIIEALVEFIQGPCRLSQKTLVDTKSIDCCRDLLNQGMGNQAQLEAKGFGGSRKNLLNDLKMNSVKLLLSILEGPVDIDISSRISASLGDFQIVINRMQSIYLQFLEEELGLPADSSLLKVKQSLKRESFGGCIVEGFEIFSLLNQLAEILPEDKEKLNKFVDKDFYKFYIQNGGNIEINSEFGILRIYFPIQPICRFLTEKSKDLFIQTVSRESTQHKLLGLQEKLPGFVEEMDHLEIMSHHKVQITPSRLNYMRDFSTLMAVLIGATIISSYKYEYLENDNGSRDYSPNIHYYQNQIVFYCGCVQGITSFMLVVGFCVNKINLIVRAGWRQRVEQNEIEMLVEKKQISQLREQALSELKVEELDISVCRMILQIEGPYSPVFYDEQTRKRNFGHYSMIFEYYWNSLSFLISDGEFIFMIMYFIFSIQGLLQSPVFYSFHLLDVINRFPQLQRVMQTVTVNLSQLLMTGMLMFITIYICIVVYFLFVSSNLNNPAIDSQYLNRAGSSFCQSLLDCYASGISYGLRMGGGMGDQLPGYSPDSWNIQEFYLRFVMDLIFSLSIQTILLNVVLGVIVDSFASLREAASEREEDIKNVCFICGLDRYTLDRDTEEGFDYHVNNDHYIWNYVYFIIHLKLKDTSDFNGVESIIYTQLEQDEMEWFPQHKSILLIKSRKAKLEEAGHSEHHQDDNAIETELLKIDKSLQTLGKIVKLLDI